MQFGHSVKALHVPGASSYIASTGSFTAINTEMLINVHILYARLDLYFSYNNFVLFIMAFEILRGCFIF